MEELLRAGVPEEALVSALAVDYDNELGRGSDAAVYQGLLESLVAVKVLHPVLLQERGPGRQMFLQRFGRECNRLRSLTHPNVVRFMGVSTAKNQSPALVTELMDMTLEQYYKTRQLSLSEQVDLFCDAAAGLAFIHSRGVIHRDLTTRNVLLSKGPPRRAKLSDVGISRTLFGDDVLAAADNRSGLTQCPGTMNYMPPEALADRPVYTEKLDSFSMGVLMMAVVVGHEPSARLMMADRSVLHVDGNRTAIPESRRRAEDLNSIRSDHPVRSLIVRCLANEPGDRPSAGDVFREMSALQKRLSKTPTGEENLLCMDCIRQRNEIRKKGEENAKLTAQRDKAEWERDKVVAQRDETVAQLDKARDKVERLTTQNQVLAADNECLLAEVEQLKRKLSAMTSEKSRTSSATGMIAHVSSRTQASAAHLASKLAGQKEGRQEMLFDPLNCGKNVKLLHNNTVAKRVDSYDKAIVYTEQPLQIGYPFEIRVDAIDVKYQWAGSLKLGVTSCNRMERPTSSDIICLTNLKGQEDYLIMSYTSLYHKNNKKELSIPSFNELNVGDTVGLYVSRDGDLHIRLNRLDQGAVARGLPTGVPLFAVVDVYGKATQVSIVSDLHLFS